MSVNHLCRAKAARQPKPVCSCDCSCARLQAEEEDILGRLQRTEEKLLRLSSDFAVREGEEPLSK